MLASHVLLRVLDKLILCDVAVPTLPPVVELIVHPRRTFDGIVVRHRVTLLVSVLRKSAIRPHRNVSIRNVSGVLKDKQPRSALHTQGQHGFTDVHTPTTARAACG